MKEEITYTEITCDYCKGPLNHRITDYIIDVGNNLDFCNEYCQYKYHFEKDRIAIPYKQKIYRDPEFFWHGNDLYYNDYKVEYVFERDIEACHSNTRQNLILILSDSDKSKYCTLYLWKYAEYANMYHSFYNDEKEGLPSVRDVVNMINGKTNRSLLFNYYLSMESYKC